MRALVQGCRRLLSERGESNGMSVARELIERLDPLADEALDGFFDFLAGELGPDPAQVLRLAEVYAARADAPALIALQGAVEPPRQELFRRLNRAPRGTAAVLRLRRALLRRLAQHPEWRAIEADLLHLLSSWFNPGFLRAERVDWNSPAQLLEKIILHEAVHTIDGWDDLRRRLQPDRRCFAFFHPQLAGEPLIFVEVALLPEMPEQIGPLIDKLATPLAPEQFRVAAFYGISNCEAGLRHVSLGNFLIKEVAEQLRQELPRLRTFCTLSPMPGFAAWLRARPDPAALPGLGKAAAARLRDAQGLLEQACGGDLEALQSPALHDRLDAAAQEALLALAAAYLGHASVTPQGDPVARFHLDNGARLERLNLRGNLSPAGLKQSFGIMVNYLYDLDRVETHHAKFRRGVVVRSRAVAALL
ncbi:MAG: malonyl-CoA decarboxylase family protein [Rubrivivax sp.]